ncbi:MAG: hypothetical protein AB7I27_16310 [Bacteriovoracaceae bacterium]
MKLSLLVLVGAFSTQFAFASQNMNPEPWEGFSEPEIMGSGFTHRFNELPLEGSIDTSTKAWSGDYWASNKGGINYRWNAVKKVGFDYESPTREQALALGQDYLAQLSPSEKYDLLIGSYDYPMKKAARADVSKMASDWAGICHGWAPASLHHNEPTPKVLTNPDGVKIPFGSSDIKALLSFYYANFTDKLEYGQAGMRCYFGRWMGGMRGCDQDLNAGAFHIVLANKIGLQKEGFVVDVDRYRQVWNQPAIGYKSQVISEEEVGFGAASTAVRVLRVVTQFTYVDEQDPNSWEPVKGTENQKNTTVEYTYLLELDAYDRIVGGKWISAIRPDYIWFKKKETVFKGILSRLPELLND